MPRGSPPTDRKADRKITGYLPPHAIAALDRLADRRTIQGLTEGTVRYDPGDALALFYSAVSVQTISEHISPNVQHGNADAKRKKHGRIKGPFTAYVPVQKGKTALLISPQNASWVPSPRPFRRSLKGSLSVTCARNTGGGPRSRSACRSDRPGSTGAEWPPPSGARYGRWCAS